MTSKIKEINKRFGFNQWGNRRYRENIYSGCYNNCLYCGIKKTQCGWLNNRDEKLWYLMKFNRKNFNKNIYKRKGISIFPTAHDMFSFNKRICFKFLKKLINPSKNVYNKVLVVSKPRLSVFKEFLKYFSRVELLNYIEIRFTITTNKDSLIRFWEGNSSLYKERVKALDYCYSYDNGDEILNSLVIEPYLDTPYELISLIEDLKDNIRGDIWVGHMNRISSEDKLKKLGFSDEYIENFKTIRSNCSTDKLNEIVDGLKNNRQVRYKESFLDKDQVLITIPKYQIPTI